MSPTSGTPGQGTGERGCSRRSAAPFPRRPFASTPPASLPCRTSSRWMRAARYSPSPALAAMDRHLRDESRSNRGQIRLIRPPLTAAGARLRKASRRFRGHDPRGRGQLLTTPHRTPVISQTDSESPFRIGLSTSKPAEQDDAGGGVKEGFHARLRLRSPLLDADCD